MIHFVKYQLNLLILIHDVICSYYKAFLFHCFLQGRCCLAYVCLRLLNKS